MLCRYHYTEHEYIHGDGTTMSRKDGDKKRDNLGTGHYHYWLSSLGVEINSNDNTIQLPP